MRKLAKGTEAQIRDFGEAGHIVAARIVRTADGYLLTVAIRGMRAELLAYTTRKQPRTWMSLDRLLASLARLAPGLEAVELLLTAPDDWESRLIELAKR